MQDRYDNSQQRPLQERISKVEAECYLAPTFILGFHWLQLCTMPPESSIQCKNTREPEKPRLFSIMQVKAVNYRSLSWYGADWIHAALMVFKISNSRCCIQLIHFVIFWIWLQANDDCIWPKELEHHSWETSIATCGNVTLVSTTAQIYTS